jgi:hypothetical protein
MTAFDPVQPPLWNEHEGLPLTLRQIDDYCSSPPVLALAKEFGAPVETWGAHELPDEIAAFASANWDFRSGKERDVASRVSFDTRRESLILDAAEALGLRTSNPPSRRSYDSIVALGGLVRGCIARTKFARQLVDEGVRVREFTALGARRPLSENEIPIARALGLQASDEFEALEAGMRRSFAGLLVEPPKRKLRRGASDADSSEEVTWQLAGKAATTLRAVSVIAAPATRPGAARANTAEAYEFWIAQEHAQPIRSVLAVTHPIYVPYQGCVAIRALGVNHGIGVETIGITDQAADLGDLTQLFGAQEYLQELNAALNEMARLRRDLSGSAAG